MKNLLFGLLILISTSLTAQSSYFVPHVPKAAEAVGQTQKITPNAAAYFAVPTPGDLAKFLQRVPGEHQPSTDGKALLNLPSPNGKVSTFRLTRYQMITDELQARYPHYVTAYGWDVDAPERRIFLEWTDLGFSASVRGGEEGRWYVSPQFQLRQDLYQVYFTSDYPVPAYNSHCDYEPDEALMDEIAALGPPMKSVGDCELREYDLALACTGEYYAAVGGTEAAVVAEMMTAINRVNEVFRADLAITLKIINLPVSGGGIELVFDNPASDPYTNEDGSIMLGENQTTVDNVIGTANYDIGHVFSTGGGGIAALGSPCDAGAKAQGVTGLPNPVGDPFYIDFVAHEIGHQFGGNHTFNSTEVNCATRNGGTAYEPGGGTTIQAYAGICGPTANIQLNSDPYYHAVSIQEISAYMELGGGASCATTTSTANGAPTVNAGTDFTIPANTPFLLTATGSDPNGDALTYCWEQFDLGPVVAGIPTGNETDAPLFRSLPPTTSPERYLPNLTDLVASGSSTWEVLPKVARNLTFIVTIRDFGAAGYGCTVQDQMDITVEASTGFKVNAPNGGETWIAGNMETVTWDVAGTGAGTAVDCDMVEIVLSTDGGMTFDQVLATVPNTGTATVTAPTVTETDARIMIRCDGNIFFDISDADFSIEQTDYDYTLTMETSTACNGATSAGFAFELASLQGYTGTINYSAANLPGAATISFNPSSTTLASGGTQAVSFTLDNIGGLAAGDYVFQVITDDGITMKSEDYTLTVKPSLAAPTLITPTDGGSLQLTAATFNWSSVTNASLYRIEICTNAAFTNCFTPQTTTNTSINYGSSFESFFNPGDMAYWRITAIDESCDPDAEAASAIASFTWAGANSLNVNTSSITICEGEDTADEYTLSFTNGALTGPATLSITNQPAGLMATVNPTTISDGGNATVSLAGEETLMPGSYTITVNADDGANTEDLNLTLIVSEDAVVVNSPADGEEVLLEPNGSCTSSGLATFVDFNFDAYTGPGTVVGYTLFRDVVGGGSFPPVPVTPGSNVQGLCLSEGEMISFTIQVELSDGSLLTTCSRVFTATENPLPVEWQAFTAEPRGKTSLLNWAVIQDAEHAAFTVERSITGRNGWQDIARIVRTGANRETVNYSYVDSEVRDGNTYFYRLRQQDLDGATDYSVIRSVTFQESVGISAFPNPASDQLTVRTGSDLPQDLDFQLYDALGKQQRQGQIRNGQAIVDLRDLPTAVYQLVVSDGKSVREVIRVVVR